MVPIGAFATDRDVRKLLEQVGLLNVARDFAAALQVTMGPRSLVSTADIDVIAASLTGWTYGGRHFPTGRDLPGGRPSAAQLETVWMLRIHLR